jgi:hypothetical protein
VPMKSKALVHEKRILNIIMLIRGEKVILDSDLAALYGVETRRLNEQVRRNIAKFLEDFMFQLSDEEFANLKSQIATSSSSNVESPKVVLGQLRLHRGVIQLEYR